MLPQSAALKGQNQADERSNGEGLERRASGSRLHTLAMAATTPRGVVHHQALTGRVSRHSRWHKPAPIFSGCQGRSRYPSPT
jgi:hypothetical protein